MYPMILIENYICYDTFTLRFLLENVNLNPIPFSMDSSNFKNDIVLHLFFFFYKLLKYEKKIAYSNN